MPLRLLSGLLFFLWFHTLSANQPKPPNFIVIMVDDMGYAGLGCYGNPYFKTPELDRLAEEGMRFTDFHSSGTVCSPTRAGLLTGRYQQRAGIEAVIHPKSDHPEHRKGLKLSETTFAEVLKEAGYATGLIGKWHQGYPQNSDDYHPQNHGFDEFVGYHSGNIDFISHVGDHYAHDWWHGREETPEEGYSTHLINKYANDFLNKHGSNDKPFCLYIAHEAIHNPLQVPGDPVRRTVDEWQRWDWKNASKKDHIKMYKGMTLPVDEGLGQIRKILDEKGIAENTFIFFFSDNGPSRDLPSASDKWRGAKGSVYEGGHRVPAIAWWPGRITPGKVSDATGISLDIMPTLLSLAGVKKTDLKLDGVDISPLILKQEKIAERPLFWASLGNGGQRSEAMRDGPWKLVVNHHKAKPGTFENEKVELYKLDDDPGEKGDLAGAAPKKAAEMLQRLKQWYAETQATKTHQPGGWLNFFNSKDLKGWKGNPGFWSVKDGAIVGHSDNKIEKNEFLWSEEPVADFYLSVDVKQIQEKRNAGIQFRSKPINDHGQALGYQADAGPGLWGKLYHEHGRKKLDWNNQGNQAAKPGDWNHYEILAVGDRIWTAVNGQLCTAVKDPEGERTGQIALQIHSGPAQTVYYRSPTLAHNPPVTLAGLDEDTLNSKLKPLKFNLEANDTVVFMGGSGIVKQVVSGELESLLTKPEVHFRDLSWQADTVYQRQRPRNFGTQLSALEKIDCNVVIAAFGQMEAMDGTGRIPEFIKAYEKMLDEDVCPRTNRIVLVTPHRFSKVSNQPHYPDLTTHNDAVKAYSRAVKDLASRRGWLSVDLSDFNPEGNTIDGIRLTSEGHANWAREVALQLLGSPPPDPPSPEMRKLIQQKNTLWQRHWRPTNWAFVYGNRQHVPSSKDHRPGKPRWFPEELEAILPEIEKVEKQIYNAK